MTTFISSSGVLDALDFRGFSEAEIGDATANPTDEPRGVGKIDKPFHSVSFSTLEKVGSYSWNYQLNTVEPEEAQFR